jgi:predicted transcriptional regulator
VEKYITIQEFMWRNLHLKDSELIIFATIYGFSQDRESAFHGSLEYLAKITGQAKETVCRQLKRLMEKGLIVREKQGHYAFKSIDAKSMTIDGKSIKALTENQRSVDAKSTDIDGKSTPSNNNTYNTNYNDSVYKNTHKFTPPTFEEVLAYAKKRNCENIAQKFYDYFTADDDPKNHWIDSKGQKVRRWKQKFITWETHAPKTMASPERKMYGVHGQLDFDEEGF